MAISGNDAQLSASAGTNQTMDLASAFADPLLADAFDAAATDSDAIHHVLCHTALLAKPGCSCGVPTLLKELARILETPQPGVD